jgi:transcriptional regulator with XRE-family HTH domain
MTKIGMHIKTRRIELGMSQDELAERMGYKNRSTIAKIEKGVNDVTQTNIVKFANVLNTSIAYLMGWEETPEEMHEKNDTATDIVLRLGKDEEFSELVKILLTLDNEQIKDITRMLNGLLK